MAWIFSGSQSPATGPEAMWMLKNLLVDAGWVVFSSSNGTTLVAGDTHTTATSLANANAYFAIRQPQGATSSADYGGVRREFAFQRTTTNLIWRIAYGYNGLNLGGTNVLIPSSAVDPVQKQFILGNGTAGVALFSADAGYRWHVGTENTSPYSLWASAVPNGGGTPTTAILFEPMMSGTFTHLDTDPYVFYTSGVGGTAFPWLARPVAGGVSSNNLYQAVSSSTFNQSPRTWMAKGAVNESWTGCSVLPYVSLNNNALADASPGIGVNALTGNDDVLPIAWAKISALGGTSGYKGIGKNMRFSASARATADTISTISSGSKDYIIMRDIILPWDSSDPQI